MHKRLYEKLLTEDFDGVQVDYSEETDSLKKNLYELYKWDYLVDTLKAHPKSQFDRRYEGVIKLIYSGIESLIQEIKKAIEPIFATWLEHHAITSPHDWATNRYSDFEEYGNGMKNLEFIKSEYVRYAVDTHVITKDVDADWKGFNDAIQKNTKVLKFLEKYLQQSLVDLISQAVTYEDLKGNLPGIFAIIREWGEEEIWPNILKSVDDKKLFILLNEELIFPLWYKKWVEKGLLDTIANVEKQYQILQNIANEPASQQPKLMNIIINTAHQTGKMTDYIADKYDIDTEYLHYLSNIPQTEIDKWIAELKKDRLLEKYVREEFVDYVSDKEYGRDFKFYIYKNPTPTEWRRFIPTKARGFIDSYGNIYVEGYEDKKEYAGNLHTIILKALQKHLKYLPDDYYYNFYSEYCGDESLYGIAIQMNGNKVFLSESYASAEDDGMRYDDEAVTKLFEKCKKINPTLEF